MPEYERCGGCFGTGKINPTGQMSAMCFQCMGTGRVETMASEYGPKNQKGDDKRSGGCLHFVLFPFAVAATLAAIKIYLS
jgi:hypothetical protein